MDHIVSYHNYSAFSEYVMNSCEELMLLSCSVGEDS